MGRITPSFRQLHEETISELRTELQAALVDLGHKNAFSNFILYTRVSFKIVDAFCVIFLVSDLEYLFEKCFATGFDNLINFLIIT
jgi:hypothetical protein